MLHGRKGVSHAFVLSVLFCVLFFCKVHAQDKAIEGIDMGFDNSMRYTVGTSLPFDAIWQPWRLAEHPKSYISYFENVLYSSGLRFLRRGYGVSYKRKKHCFVFFGGRISTLGSIMFPLDEKAYRFGYGYRLSSKLYAGMSLKWIYSDSVGWVPSGNGKGLDIGFYYAPSDKAGLELLSIDLDTTRRQTNGVSYKLSSLYVLQGTFSFLKNNVLKVSPEIIYYDVSGRGNDFRLGFSYRFKEYGAIRFIVPDAGSFVSYGATLKIQNLFLHYDILDTKIKVSNTDKNDQFLSATLSF